MRAHAYYFFPQNAPNDISDDGCTKKVANFFSTTEQVKHMKRITRVGYKTRERKKHTVLLVQRKTGGNGLIAATEIEQNFLLWLLRNLG